MLCLFALCNYIPGVQGWKGGGFHRWSRPVCPACQTFYSEQNLQLASAESHFTWRTKAGALAGVKYRVLTDCSQWEGVKTDFYQ